MGSKEELAIDEYVTITTKVSATATDVENIGDESIGDEARKVLRDGQLMIVRGGEVYTVVGTRLK